MNKQEVETKLQNIITHVEKTGVPGEEVKKYYEEEFKTSIDMGMTEEDGYLRSIISTVNYYRKKLDKMGNRITFLCLGVSQPTDYGLSKKVKEIKKAWSASDTTSADRTEMIEKGLVNHAGIPLHTPDTTFLKAKEGFPIVVDEEISQNMVGVVKQDDKIFPAIIRVYSKKECDTKKIMYQWTSISADQIQTKNNVGYISLVSRELGMMVIPNTSRITIDEYKDIVENDSEYKKIIYDMSNQDHVNALEAMSQIQNAKHGHVFLKNVRITGYTQFTSTYGTGSEITKNDIKAVTDWNAPIIADIRIPDNVELDVDPNTTEELWLLVLPKEKKQQDKRMKFEVLGMYTNTPLDRTKFKMSDGFLKDDENKLITSQSTPFSTEMESFHQKIIDM